MTSPRLSNTALSFRLMKALDLSRRGWFAEAEHELAPSGVLPEETLALHALATLATNSGDYARGLHLWRLLLERDPGNAEAGRMVEAIELWLSRPTWVRYAPLSAGVAGALLLVIFLLWAVAEPQVPVRPAPQPLRATSTVPAATPSEQKSPTLLLPALKPARKRSP